MFRDYDEYYMPQTKEAAFLERVADHFEAVLECIFKTGDTEKLFDHLEEVAHYLNVDFKNIDMKLKKRD